MSDSATKRRDILDAALNAFLKFGPRRTSMEDVAEAAGMSRPAIYQYFRNRAELFRSMVSQLHEDTLKAVADALEARGPLEPRLVRAILARDGAFLRLFRESPHGEAITELHTSTAADLTEKAGRLYQSLLADALKGDGYAREDAETTALLLVAAAQGLKSQAETDRAFETSVRHLVTYVVAGLDALS